MSTDTLIFWGIIFVIVAVALAICFIIIRAIFRFIISLFKKEPKVHTMEGALVDKGEDLGIYVEGLERSKAERARVQPQAGFVVPVRGPAIESRQPMKKGQKEVPVDKEKEYTEKMQQGVKADLDRLKSRSRGEDPAVQYNNADIKLPKGLEQLAKSRVVAEGFSQKQTGEVAGPVLKSQAPETPSQKGPVPPKAAAKQKDTSFFRGREGVKMHEAAYEITRKTSPYLKGGSGGTYTLKERQEIAKKITDVKKFGTLLQKSDKARIMNTLNKEKLRASPSQRAKIQKQERFIKNLFK